MDKVNPIDMPYNEAGSSFMWSSLSGRTQLILILLVAMFIAALADRVIAASIGFFDPNAGATYRRVGPETGPQVFVAGSSLLQFALSWPEVSKTLGQGIENWGVAASSPDIWEVSQHLATNSNLMIIGVSFYDLNEYHLADSRANIVPFAQTVLDLRGSGASWQFSRRVLSQYPLAYVRALFPTAANSDAVLVGLREVAKDRLGLASGSEDRDRGLVLPSMPVLQFGEITTRLSDWPEGKLLRRLSLLRAENRGLHAFNGPKRLAFRRMLTQAQKQGRVIIVVLPVASEYEHEFITPKVTQEFENVLSEAQHTVPGATVVRLDHVPGLHSGEYFSDFVHLNSAGRTIATKAFTENLKCLQQGNC